MTYSALLRYAHSILAHVPWPHWVIMGMLSLAGIFYLLSRKRQSMYGAFCFGIILLIGLFLLDAAVFIRLSDTVHPEIGFSLAAEYRWLNRGGADRMAEMLANVAAFIPFGFFLSEFLSTTKRLGFWRRVGLATLYTFVLSLLIESLQLILRLGVFEITDLVLNTAGGFVGAGMAVMVRKVMILGKGK